MAATNIAASTSAPPDGRREPEWRPLIACVARITRLTWRTNTRSGSWTVWDEVAYDACPVRLDAPTFGRLMRGHRGIENRAHHVRDRLPREGDGRRNRREPGVGARPGSCAVNLPRANGVADVSEAIDVNARSLDRLLAYAATRSAGRAEAAVGRGRPGRGITTGGSVGRSQRRLPGRAHPLGRGPHGAD